MENRADPIKELKTLHLALCIGALLIVLICHFFIRSIELNGLMDTLSLFSIAGLLIAVLNVLSATYLFNKRTEELGVDINSENLNDYRAAYVLKWSLIEAAILINAMFYFILNADPINIVVSILLLLILYFSKPSII